MTTKTLVVADVHGHFDRLEALLLKAGIIGPCPDCLGRGEVADDWTVIDCENCHGDGTARIDKDTQVIQLGDLGHFGVTGSPTGDMLCWRAAYNGWIDVVLWGNHDRAIVDAQHQFKGYMKPDIETLHYVKAMLKQNRLRIADTAHGWLLTHAGLHSSFKHQPIEGHLKTDPQKLVNWLNDQDEIYLNEEDGATWDPEAQAIRDAISVHRGGRESAGGILWRHAGESLFGGFPQVFGHTASDKIRHYDQKHMCIDVGSQHNGRLIGVMLPSKEVYGVDL